MATQTIIAEPRPVKFASQYAYDVDEAEQATLSRPIVQFEEKTISRPSPEKRSLNASRTNSDATTLVDAEDEQGILPLAQRRGFYNDEDRSPLEAAYTRLKTVVSTITFPKVGTQAEKDVFVKEQCGEVYPMGWPRLAAFQNQSDSCAVYRRFGLLFCRLLVQLEGELTCLEKKLLELDKGDAADTAKLYRLRSSDDDATWDPAKREILREIQEKLSDYGHLLDADARLRELGPAPSRNHRNVYNWMRQHRPLDEGHDDFILREDDFITPVKKSQQGSGINDFIETIISRRPKCLLKALLGFKNHKAEQKEKGMHIFSCHRIALVANIIAVCIAISVLLIPVFVLYLANITRVQSSGVVLVFTILFATVISLVADAKVENIFMSTCGYCAVLVVFLGNVQQQYTVTAPPNSGQG